MSESVFNSLVALAATTAWNRLLANPEIPLVLSYLPAKGVLAGVLYVTPKDVMPGEKAACAPLTGALTRDQIYYRIREACYSLPILPTIEPQAKER